MLQCITACLLIAAPIPKDVIEREKAAQELRADTTKLAARCNAMPTEGAAAFLKKMVESDKLDQAARILSQMRERKAAAALADMDDPVLILTLVERMRQIREKPDTPREKP